MTKIQADMGALRFAAWTRAGGRCEITGMILPGGPDGEWALHHRRKKGMGGTNKPDTHTLQNVLACTHRAHNLGRPSVHLDVNWARDRGYLLHWTDCPRTEPVWLLRRTWVLLTPDGRYLPVARERPAVLAAGGAFTGGITDARGGRYGV